MICRLVIALVLVPARHDVEALAKAGPMQRQAVISGLSQVGCWLVVDHGGVCMVVDGG